MSEEQMNRLLVAVAVIWFFAACFLLEPLGRIVSEVLAKGQK